MSVKIAFAATGNDIDQHFGSARYWQIYDLADDGTYAHIESRKTAAKCQGGCEGGFDHLAEALKDCGAVFVSKIGPGAAAFMISRGMRIFEAAGGIDEILTRFAENDLRDGG